MRVSAMVVMLLLFGAEVVAQTTAGSTAAVFTGPPASESCPVNFSVERKSNSGLIAVDGGKEARGQGLRVNLASAPSKVRIAEITVHGMTAGDIIPAASPAHQGDDATETFESNANGAAALVHSSVWTKKLTAVTWVELTRLVYANGTTWQPSQGSRCNAAPSLLVLVAAAQ
jgi:hypothetical protein